MNDSKFGRKTSPGFADPHSAVRLGDHPAAKAIAPPPVVTPAALPAMRSPLPPSEHSSSKSQRPRAMKNSKPLVEIEVIRERSRAPRPEQQGGCYEIWTQNHVYAVDSRMRCVEVRDASGERKSDHPFLNGRLVGGQAQEPSMEMSHPLPRPGSFAVFELRKGNRRQFTRTSAVERVVLRLRIVTIADGIEVPSWDELVAQDDD